MKKIVFIVTGLVFFAGFVFAQDTTKMNNPDEQIIVNKKYDEQGNLIQFDSTYVHQWSYSSSDSTGQFVFPDDEFFGGFPDMEKILQEFMGGHNMPHGSSPFDDEFFEHFKHNSPDSAMNRQFFSHRDTSFFNFPNDSLNNFPKGFPDMEELMQGIQKQFNNLPDNFGMPQFQSEEQQKEWEELMKKHQQEMEEFQKKWGTKN